MLRFYAECIDKLGEPVLIILKERTEKEAIFRLRDAYKIRELVNISTTPVRKPRDSFYPSSLCVVGTAYAGKRKTSSDGAHVI